ncbi:MAG: type III-B CRISPR module-associated protein Cmr3 [candidate division WOR-3 bacterium]
MSVLIYLEPLDTLFFRDSRPFIAGEDTLAESGLPSPLTLYGVIGDYYLKKQNKSIEDFYYKKDEKLGQYKPELIDSNLKIKGVFLKKDNSIYIPVPANLYAQNRNCYSVLLPHQSKDGSEKWDINNQINPIKIPTTTHSLKPVQGYIDIKSLKPYLTHNKQNFYPIIYPESKFLKYEKRFGNRVTKNTKTVEQLYWTNQLRFDEYLERLPTNEIEYLKAKIGILIDGLDKFDFTDGDTLSIGGERKRAKITLGDENILSCLDDEEVKKKIQETKKFFVYFITPVIFNAGWISKEFLQKFNGAQLVGAVVNKPIYFSGWIRETASKGRPRPIIKAVPAGSVYFFSFENNNNFDFNNIYDNYNLNESLSDIYPNAGFGIALIGAWDY